MYGWFSRQTIAVCLSFTWHKHYNAENLRAVAIYWILQLSHHIPLWSFMYSTLNISFQLLVCHSVNSLCCGNLRYPGTSPWQDLLGLIRETTCLMLVQHQFQIGITGQAKWVPPSIPPLQAARTHLPLAASPYLPVGHLLLPCICGFLARGEGRGRDPVVGFVPAHSRVTVAYHSEPLTVVNVVVHAAGPSHHHKVIVTRPT